MSDKISNTLMRDSISSFLAEHDEICASPEAFDAVLKKTCFYSVFNSNASTLSKLLDQKTSTELGNDVEFSDEEKAQINCFLEWNNKNKDKCVYQNGLLLLLIIA